MNTKEYGVEDLLVKLEELRLRFSEDGMLGLPEDVTPALRLFIQRVGKSVEDAGLVVSGAFAAGVMFGVRIGRNTDIKVFKNEA